MGLFCHFFIVTVINMLTLGTRSTCIILRHIYEIGLKQFRPLPSSNHVHQEVQKYPLETKMAKYGELAIDPKWSKMVQIDPKRSI